MWAEGVVDEVRGKTWGQVLLGHVGNCKNSGSYSE